MTEDPTTLLAHAAKLTMYIMLRRTKNGSALRENLGDHLRWMIGAEKAGKIFLSGPVGPHDGATQLDGLTILRVGSLAEAAVLAMEDPFVQRGIVDFELCEWTVNEGAIPMMVTLSDSMAVIR